ncbi:MAG: glycosyltransferase family 4 protein [Chloroflexi bacterium]|nr:glycosyltransferase family 4 protein [Chloroflexota bacterium]
MRLLCITYKVDERDSLVGYVVGWINGLARHMDRVEVICLASGQAALADNARVHSLGKERGAGRIERALNLARVLWRLRADVDAVFCQFSPEYVLAVAPLAKLCRWPIALWYTHRHVDWRLRFAVALADRVFTASPESFRLPTPKARVIGHGIDTERFSPPPDDSTHSRDHPIVLAVGRRAPIKNYEMLIDAAQLLKHEARVGEFEVRIVGGDEGNAPEGYARSLQERIDRAGLTDTVKLIGPVAYDRIPAEYHAATAGVNLCPTGGMDKAVLEGMAAGVATLVRNETFKPVFGEDADLLVAPDGDVDAVAARLGALLRLPEGERRALGVRLRERAVAEFGQGALVERLATALLELKS